MSTPDRDLDAAIATEIYGWSLAKGAVPPDYDGGNAGDVLTEDARPVKDWVYPPKGKVSVGYFVPEYSRDFHLAIGVANYVGLRFGAGKIPTNPEYIARMALEHFRKDKR